jgi:hypothetical protein
MMVGRQGHYGEGTASQGAVLSSANADVAEPRKRYTVTELLDALEKQEMSEQEFLAELAHVREESDGKAGPQEAHDEQNAIQQQVSLLAQEAPV